MAYTLNTSHPLYANLIELIGVQGGALVSHKTARVFTVDAAASFGSGVWGEHFHAAGGSYTNRGASFSPAIGVDTTSLANYTVVTILNSSGVNENSLSLSNNTGTPVLRGPGLSAGQISVSRAGTGTTSLGTTNHLLAYCRIGETSYKMYVDNGVLDYSTTSAAPQYNDPATNTNYIGSVGAGSSCSLDIVWSAVFNKELSQAEIQSLYGSIGAANAFGLVESGGTQTLSPTIFTGTPTFYAPSLVYSRNLSPSVYNNNPNFFTAIVSVGGTIVTPPLKNNTGTLLASLSGWAMNVYNASTGALVLHKTGLSTDAAGVLTVTDAALTAATTYAYEPVHATYGRRLPTATAS